MSFPSDRGDGPKFGPAGVNRRRFLRGVATAVTLPMFETFVARDVRAAAATGPASGPVVDFNQAPRAREPDVLAATLLPRPSARGRRVSA